jgi:hypothetical protein
MCIIEFMVVFYTLNKKVKKYKHLKITITIKYIQNER